MASSVVLDFDRNPKISEIERLQSFKESVERAFNELEVTMDDLPLETHPMMQSMSKGDFRILFDDYGHFKVVTANAVEAKKGDFETLSAENLLVTGGFLAKELNAETGSYSKYLAGVKIYGDLIETNTLRADAFILKGEDGIYRRLNIDSLGQAVVDSDPKYNEKLDGSVLVAESVTADKINVTDLFSQNITARGNFYLGQGGALAYNAKDDVLSMRAKQITAATDEGLVLSDKEGTSAIRLVTQESKATIDLLDKSGYFLANDLGGLTIYSSEYLKLSTTKSTEIRSQSLIDTNMYGLAYVGAQSTNSGTNKPILMLGCEIGQGGYISGGDHIEPPFFEGGIQTQAYMEFSDTEVGIYVDNPPVMNSLIINSEGTSITGDLSVSGSYGAINCTSILASGEIVTTSGNAFRAKQGDYGFFIRNDGANVYFMLTDAGNPDGNWNGLRPLTINCASGKVSMSDLSTNAFNVSGAKPVFSYIGSNGSGEALSYATNMYVAPGGTVSRTTNTSSRTIKHDIKVLEDESICAEKLYSLPVYQAKYNADVLDKSDGRYLKDLPMFIIEDMDKVYPVAVDKPSDDVKDWSWNAQYMIPPMLKLIQDLHKDVEELKGRLN